MESSSLRRMWHRNSDPAPAHPGAENPTKVSAVAAVPAVPAAPAAPAAPAGTVGRGRPDDAHRPVSAFLDPASALVHTAIEMSLRHRPADGQPWCRSCAAMSPCRTAQESEEVWRAAGLTTLSGYALPEAAQDDRDVADPAGRTGLRVDAVDTTGSAADDAHPPVSAPGAAEPADPRRAGRTGGGARTAAPRPGKARTDPAERPAKGKRRPGSAAA